MSTTNSNNKIQWKLPTVAVKASPTDSKTIFDLPFYKIIDQKIKNYKEASSLHKQAVEKVKKEIARGQAYIASKLSELRNQIAGSDYIQTVREKYNKRPQDDLILHDLALSFDNELNKAKTFYKKDNLTKGELDDWFDGKKYFGKQLRDGEKQILPGVYLWHGRAFTGDYRTPVPKGGIGVVDSEGNYGTKGNKLYISQTGDITKPEIDIYAGLPSADQGIQATINDRQLQNKLKEWNNYVKNVYEKQKGILSDQDFLGVYEALTTPLNGELSNRAKNAMNIIISNSKYWKNLDDTDHFYRNIENFQAILLDRYKYYNGTDPITALHNQQIATVNKLFKNGELDKEQYDKDIDYYNRMYEACKENYKNDDDIDEAFFNPKTPLDAAVSTALKDAIIKMYTSNLSDYKKSIIRIANKSALQNNSVDFKDLVAAGFYGITEGIANYFFQSGFANSEKLDAELKKKKWQLENDDEALHVKNASLFNWFGPADALADKISDIDGTMQDITNDITMKSYEKIKNDNKALDQYSQMGDRIAKSLPGYTNDSDDILHQVLEKHGIDAPWGTLNEDLKTRALTLIALDQSSLQQLFDSQHDVQKQMQINMQRYRYAAQGFLEWCGATIWGIGTSFAGVVAQGFGWLLSLPQVFFYDGFMDAYANSWLAQWGQNLQSSGITGFEGLFSHGFSLLQGQKIAQEGRAFTEEEISGYLKAGAIDARTAEEMRKGTIRTGGGETFGVLVDESESRTNVGGSLKGGASAMASAAITMLGQMKGVQTITKALSEIGGLTYKAGNAIQRAGNVLQTGSAARQKLQYVVGGGFKIAGNLQTASAPYLAAVGLNSGYTLSSYQTHMQDAQSQVYSDFKDQILGAPTEKFKAMVDNNPENKYGGMNSKQYAAYLEKISEREQDRLIDEIEGGLRGTIFLKDPKLSDQNDPLSADFSTKNIDIDKVKEYTDGKIAENREYIYAMDQYMKKAKEAASSAANIEFGIVSTVDGTAMKVLRPSLYMTKTQTLAMRATKRQLMNTASKLLNKAGSLVEKIPSKRIGAAAKLIKNKFSPTSLSLDKSARSVGRIKVNSSRKVLGVESTAKDPRKQIGRENLNNMLFGFASNYAQDAGVGVDKGLYNNEIANYIKNTYSPQSIVSLMGPASPEAKDGYWGEAMAGLEGGIQAATEWNSFRDGFIGAVAGFVTPNIKWGEAKYVDKNLTVKQKIANKWSKIRGASVENSYTTWAKATWLDGFRKKTGYKVNWLGSSKTKLYKRVEDEQQFKIQAAQRVQKVLQQRGLGILSSIDQLRQAVRDAKITEEEQGGRLDPKVTKILNDTGIEIAEPVQENLQEQLLLSELILDMANADFVNENGEVINNGKNPVADLYKQYIRNKGARKQVTKERITGILSTLQEGLQKGLNPVKDIFKDDLGALSILEDLQQYTSTIEEAQGDPYSYLLTQFQSESVESQPSVQQNKKEQSVADSATSFVNETTKNAQMLHQVTEYYRNGIESAKQELGDLFVNDPLVIRAHAKQLAKLDIIQDNISKLKKEKKEIKKKLKDRFKGLLDDKGPLNAKEALTYVLIQQGFDDEAIAQAIKNEEAIIAALDSQIHSRQSDQEALLQQVQEQFGKKKKSNKKRKTKKEKVPNKLGIFEAMSLLDEIINKEKEDYEKRKSEATQNPEDIEIGENYSVAKQLKEDLVDNYRRLENLQKYGFEEVTDENGNLLMESEKLESLKAKKERLSSLQDQHEELLKIKKGEEESKVLNEGTASDEKELKDYVLSLGQVLKELLSNNPNPEMLSLVTSLLAERQEIADGEAEVYSNKTMEKQMKILEDTLGDDISSVKDLLGKIISINNAYTEYEIQRDKIVDTTRNRFSIDSFAAEAREQGIVDTLAIGYSGFADECKTYTEFIDAYDAEHQKIAEELEADNQGVDDETAQKNKQMAYFRARALDKALSQNKFFIQYNNRASQLSTHILFRAVQSLASNLDTKYKNTVADNEVSKSYQAIKEEVEKLKEETDLTEGQIQLILRNIVEHLCLRTEDGVTNDLDSIQSAIQKMNDDTEAISNRVLDSINKQLEPQNVEVDTDTISKISSLLFQQFEVLKAEDAAAKNLASQRPEHNPIEEVLGEEEGKGEEWKPATRQRRQVALDGEKLYKTTIAQISSYVSHIGDILSVISDVKKQKDSLSDSEYQAQITTAKQQLNDLAQVLVDKAGMFSKEPIEGVHQKIQSMDSTEIQFLYDTLTTIINTPYSTDIDLAETIDSMATEAVENGISEDSTAISFLLSMSNIINQQYNIPILYNRVLPTPQEQQQEKRKASVGQSVICTNPFKLSTFYRKQGGGFMRTLMDKHGVDRWLAQNAESLAGKEVVFLYNQQVWKQLQEQTPALQGKEDKSVVAVAIKDPNGSIIVHTKDRTGETISEAYQIIGFLPTDTTANTKETHRNSAGNVRKNINSSVEKYSEISGSNGEDVWVPIYDFSSESGGLITTTIKKTDAVSYDKNGAEPEERAAKADHENTKKTREELTQKNGGKTMPTGIFSDDGNNGMVANVGTKASPVKVPVKTPNMNSVVNSRGQQFSEVKAEHKKQRTPASAKALINFNKKTQKFSEQIKGLLLAVARNPTTSSEVLTALIRGQHPQSGERQPYGLIEGYENFHARNSNKGICLDNNIFCHGGKLYRCKIDGNHLDLFVVDKNGNLIDGTTVRFDLDNIDEQGTNFKEGKEEEIDQAIADFIAALSEKDGAGEIADFRVPKSSMLKSNPASIEKTNIEEAFDDGIVVIPEYGATADVTINPIQEKGVVERVNAEAESRAQDFVNRNTGVKSVDEGIKKAISLGINSITRQYKGEKRTPTVFNQQTLRNKNNLGASTENVNQNNEGSIKSNQTIMAFMLGNIVDDMAKKLASGIECKYSDYSSLLTEEEYTHLQTMINNGLKTFMRLNHFTTLMEYKSNTQLKNALEVIVKDQTLIDECIKLGISSESVSRNIMDLVMITPRGTLAIIDVKSHVGDEVAPEHLSAYVNQLNIYAKLLNDAIARLRRSGVSFPAQCIVDEIYLFEVPLASRSGINYSQEFDIRRFNREGDGEEMVEFTRKQGSTIKLVNENDAAHLTKYTIFKDEILENIIQQRRKDAIKMLTKDQKQEQEDKKKQDEQIIQGYINSEKLLYTNGAESVYYGTLKIIEVDGRYEAIINRDDGNIDHIILNTQEELLLQIKQLEREYEIQDKPAEPPKPAHTCPDDEKLIEEGGACNYDPLGKPKASSFDEELDSAMDDIELD